MRPKDEQKLLKKAEKRFMKAQKRRIGLEEALRNAQINERKCEAIYTVQKRKL